MLEIFAAGFLVFAFTALALFELAIVLGAPLGEYSFGGQNKGTLPTAWRVVAFFFVFFSLAVAGHYLAQAGVLSPLLDARTNSVVNWLLVGFTTFSAVANNLTRSYVAMPLYVEEVAMYPSILIVKPPFADVSIHDRFRPLNGM